LTDLSRIDISAARTARYVEIRRWHAGADWHPRPHAHPFCELIIALSGAARVLVEGTETICEVGEVLFYKPGTRHSEWQHGSALYEFYCLHFEWPECPQESQHHIYDYDGRIRELARWLYVDRLYDTRGIQAYRDILTQSLVSELTRLSGNPRTSSIDLIRKFVRENLGEPLNLDVLAEVCSMNKFHLARQFRAATGLTLMKYVRSIRLDVAFQLIVETALPLREIAAQTGFSSEYHLSRLIKSRYGRGTRELRRQFGSVMK